MSELEPSSLSTIDAFNPPLNLWFSWAQIWTFQLTQDHSCEVRLPQSGYNKSASRLIFFLHMRTSKDFICLQRLWRLQNVFIWRHSQTLWSTSAFNFANENEFLKLMGHCLLSPVQAISKESPPASLTDPLRCWLQHHYIAMVFLLPSVSFSPHQELIVTDTDSEAISFHPTLGRTNSLSCCC